MVRRVWSKATLTAMTRVVVATNLSTNQKSVISTNQNTHRVSSQLYQRAM